MFRLTTVVGYAMGIGLLAAALLLILLQNLMGNQKSFDPLLKGICRLILLFLGITVKVSGARHLDRTKTCLFLANHVNILDGFVLYGYIPHHVRSVELIDHFSWPLWGLITKHLGNIPISHRNTEQARRSLARAAKSVAEGTSLILLPEGHRTRDGNLGHFMSGPFRLALQTGAELIPVALRGAYERKNVHSPFVHPGRMELVFGRSIFAGSYAGKNYRQLRASVREILSRMVSGQS